MEIREATSIGDAKYIAEIYRSEIGWENHDGTTENYARQHGFQRLTLGVDDWNANAVRFYEHLGYKIFKEADGKTPGGKVFYMQKDL